jgi:prepilin signal peptidase PulO-like enzyme (type II secretory pathway)
MKFFQEMMTFLTIGLFIATLIYLAIIDAKTFLLPDKITCPLIFSGILFNFISPNPITSPVASCIGAFLGYVLIWGLNMAYLKVRGQHGIGMGDAKLLSGIGAILGWSDVLLCLLLASLSGVIGGFLWLKAKKLTMAHAFPFGPYLAVSGIALILLRIFVS